MQRAGPGAGVELRRQAQDAPVGEVDPLAPADDELRRVLAHFSARGSPQLVNRGRRDRAGVDALLDGDADGVARESTSEPTTPSSFASRPWMRRAQPPHIMPSTSSAAHTASLGTGAADVDAPGAPIAQPSPQLPPQLPPQLEPLRRRSCAAPQVRAPAPRSAPAARPAAPPRAWPRPCAPTPRPDPRRVDNRSSPLRSRPRRASSAWRDDIAGVWSPKARRPQRSRSSRRRAARSSSPTSPARSSSSTSTRATTRRAAPSRRRTFATRVPALKKLGAVVLGVSKDSIASHCKFRDKYELDVPAAQRRRRQGARGVRRVGRQGDVRQEDEGHHPLDRA